MKTRGKGLTWTMAAGQMLTEWNLFWLPKNVFKAMCTNFGTTGQLAPVINEQWDKQFVKIFVFTLLCFENCQFCLSLLNTFAPTTGHWFFVHHFITFLKFSCCQLWMHLFFKWADSAIKSATTLVHQQCRVHQHWQTTHFKVHLYSPAEASAVSMVLLHWLFFLCAA